MNKIPLYFHLIPGGLQRKGVSQRISLELLKAVDV